MDRKFLFGRMRGFLEMKSTKFTIGLSAKINFDAAFNRQRKESCSGLVVRNDKAEIICSKTTMHAHILYVFVAEAMVCLQAILLGLDLGLLVVEIEGDARSVIQKLQAQEEERFELEIYIKDSKKLCSEVIKGRENTYLVSAFAPFAAEEVNKDWRWVESAS
ncbi:hypothetical protein PVK06_046588 [Gossypium arboreum]|uniref:RNase H type-1 domain-containing protein n=1 Tax=Gossypium arboreum TaxID=29729 RepID=A0ABR0MBC5_GOSAR|nr:hypothetical protein PVK06_046588 [Gossypium arboreum]